eukprot:SM000600S19582  [mRNA]  locus=s600:581:2467:- [translate_table: standard]
MSLPPDAAAALQRSRPPSCQKPSRLRHDAPSSGGAAGLPALARPKTARCRDGRPRDEPIASSVPVVARRATLLSSLGLAAAPLLALGASLPGLTSQALAAADGAAVPAGGFGFDGLGKSEEQYTASKVVALAQAGEGAILFIGVAGYPLPIRLVIGAAEAMAVLTAAQERHNKRPATHEAWGSTLSAVGWKVERVAISDIDRDVFFSRVVLRRGSRHTAAAQPARITPSSPPLLRVTKLRTSQRAAVRSSQDAAGTSATSAARSALQLALSSNSDAVLSACSAAAMASTLSASLCVRPPPSCPLHRCVRTQLSQLCSLSPLLGGQPPWFCWAPTSRPTSAAPKGAPHTSPHSHAANAPGGTCHVAAAV